MERRILFVSLLPTLALAFALTGSCGEGSHEARPRAESPATAPVSEPLERASDREHAAARTTRVTVPGAVAREEPPAAAAPVAPPRAATPPRGRGAEPGTERVLPPLSGTWLEKLPIEGHGPVSVSVPLGATEPRPVVVGVHGRGDRPEWACGEWRGVTDAYPFVVCPHGIPVGAPPGAGLRFGSAEATEHEIRAGLAALHRRFGEHVASGPLVYAGFSLGAILAPAILTAEKHAFPYAVLAEGGQEKWTRQAIRAWRNVGGTRVLLVCSTGGCEQASRPLVARFEAEGIGARLVSAGNIGHLVDQRVIDAIRPAFPWLVGDDPRWRTFHRR